MLSIDARRPQELFRFSRQPVRRPVRSLLGSHHLFRRAGPGNRKNSGRVAALRRFAAILRSKWGELLAGETSFTVLGILLGLLALAVFFGGIAIAFSYGFTGMAGLGPVLMALGVVLVAVSMLVVQTLSTIFQADV